MCPTIVFEGDRPLLVLGAPGGTQIVMGVLQAILNVVDFGMTMAEAVSAPRFSSTGTAVDVSNRIPPFFTPDLEGQGYEVTRNPYASPTCWVPGPPPCPTTCAWLDEPGVHRVTLGTVHQ